MPLDADVEALIAKYEKLEDMLVKLYPEAVPGPIVDSTMEKVMETLSERPSRLQTLVMSYEKGRHR
jgi:acyl carrier protein phosphodiesterase